MAKSSVVVWGGRLIDPLDPCLSDLMLDELAGSLAGICRYNGAVDPHYSVAQHSVLVARHVESHGGGMNECRAGLLHDLGEALIGDMVWPFKNFTPVGPPFKEIEAKVDQAIAKRFDIRWDGVTKHLVNVADRSVLLAETRDLLGNPDWASLRVGGEGIFAWPQAWRPIVPLPRKEAYREFMEHAKRLNVVHYGV